MNRLLATVSSIGQAYATALPAAQLDLLDANDAVRALRKIFCSLQDGQSTVFRWEGRVYSRVAGERDRHLFDTEAFSIRTCRTHSDAERGYGFRVVAREVVLYLNPKTGEVLRSWRNPFTNNTVTVLHTANDPMSAPHPLYAVARDGKPYRLPAKFDGDFGRLTEEKVLWYESPLGGEYQDFVGGQYHATEVFQFFFSRSDLLDRTKAELSDMAIANFRVGPWMPWMEMGDRAGELVYIGSGALVPGGFEALPGRLRNEVKSNFATFTKPPHPDDSRPMTNSWKRFGETTPPPAAKP